MPSPSVSSVFGFLQFVKGLTTMLRNSTAIPAVGRTGRSAPVLFQFANPNIAVADWMIVVLQGERNLR